MEEPLRNNRVVYLQQWARLCAETPRRSETSATQDTWGGAMMELRAASAAAGSSKSTDSGLWRVRYTMQ